MAVIVHDRGDLREHGDEITYAENAAQALKTILPAQTDQQVDELSRTGPIRPDHGTAGWCAVSAQSA